MSFYNHGGATGKKLLCPRLAHFGMGMMLTWELHMGHFLQDKESDLCQNMGIVHRGPQCKCSLRNNTSDN